MEVVILGETSRSLSCVFVVVDAIFLNRADK